MSGETLKTAVEDTRVMLEAATRLMFSGSDYTLATVSGDSARTTRINPRWLEANKLVSFDPFNPTIIDALAINSEPPKFLEQRLRASLAINKVRVLAQPTLMDLRVRAALLTEPFMPTVMDVRVRAALIQERIVPALTFLLDAIWHSTIRAAKNWH